ncbi:unnamed protein product [Periconia digitata]|uniref:Uncharacterized protein n=1 Tax=Periconia digitata TaxID=1303443 RepID=A0A9W4XGT3_9PLEO|nr:unnamed protein product [Periconia digitata]
MELVTKNKSKIEDAMGKMSGALDASRKAHNYDHDLDRILLIIHAYMGSSMDEKNSLSRLEEWMESIVGCLRIDELEIRLASSLGDKLLADNIVDLMYQIATPKLTFDMFFKFKAIFLNGNGKTPVVKYGLPGSLMTEAPQTASRTIEPASNSREQDRQDKAMNKARESLCDSDKQTPIEELQPISKQYTLKLLAFLYSGRSPESGTPIYATFGYQACKTKEQVHRLSVVYTKMLIKTPTQAKAFKDFWKAAESHQLVKYIDKRGYKNSRLLITELSTALESPYKGNESVWVLKAFVSSSSSSPSDDPPCSLIRDYAFHLCRNRNEVEELKAIYNKLIKSTTLISIYHACIKGRLQELA